jgi:hypothetical protein
MSSTTLYFNPHHPRHRVIGRGRIDVLDYFPVLTVRRVRK